ncbi:MAG: hypothetical protein KAX55_06220 [Propionivibrio sp.]|nr:hypothetical protein [Propionivibrio sp.]
MTTQLHPAWRSQAHQRGIALVVALILLVIATLSGIAGIRNTTLQETMTGNFYDRSLAMQAAEAGIVAALAALSEDVPTIAPVDCASGAVLCRVVPENAFTGTDANWHDAGDDFVVNAALMAGTQPQFHVQWIGIETIPLTGQAANCLQYGAQSSCPESSFNLYRITARSGNPTIDNGRAIVVLSSLARVPVGS